MSHQRILYLSYSRTSSVINNKQANLMETSLPLCCVFDDHANKTHYYTTYKGSQGQTLIPRLRNTPTSRYHFRGSTCNSTSSIVPLCDSQLSVNSHNSVMFRKRASLLKPGEQSFLLLPLGFFAQSRPEASVDSSADVPVSGSPAGKNLSRVLGPQLVPGQRNKDRAERDRRINKGIQY